MKEPQFCNGEVTIQTQECNFCHFHYSITFNKRRAIPDYSRCKVIKKSPDIAEEHLDSVYFLGNKELKDSGIISKKRFSLR
jgi:hypothetical protein